MVALAGSDASTVPANALAEKLDLSYNYLLTIVAELRRAGFVKIRRGPAGGLQLARPAHTITLSEIICAIDGPLTLADGTQPTTPADQDSGNQLPSLWVAAHQAMLEVFARVTLSEASLIGVRPPIRRRGRPHRVASAQRLPTQGARELHHPTMWIPDRKGIPT
jgi:Rrf2 family iron-sulfur cluster assembly transcriptional regulator